MCYIKCPAYKNKHHAKSDFKILAATAHDGDNNYNNQQQQQQTQEQQKGEPTAGKAK